MVALQGDLVLLLAADLPFLGGDLGVLAHAEAGGAIGDRRDVQPDVLELDVRDVVELLAERARLLEFAQPVRQTLAEANLHAAQAVDAAHQGEIAGIAVDHAGRLDRGHHAGRAGHHGREGGDGGVDAGIHQHFAGDVAEGERGHHDAPHREVGLAALQQVDHVARDRHRELDGVIAGQRTVDLGERRAHARGQPDINRPRHGDSPTPPARGSRRRRAW
jgi:hypothetical protein